MGKTIQATTTRLSKERIEELRKKMQDTIDEVSKEIGLLVCETDDNNAVSKPVNVTYDEADNRLYIESTYQFDESRR